MHKFKKISSILLFAFLLAGMSHSAHAKPNDKLQNRPYADLKRWHLGFSVGFHVQDLNFTHNGFLTPDGEKWSVEVPNFSPGFCLNVMGDLRLHKYLNLRFSPGIYFGSKSAVMMDYQTETIMRQDIKSAYVVAPIDLKISGERLHNVRPYLTTGIMASFDVTKKQASDYLSFKTFDTYLCVGLGTDFYLPFFKFIPEIKFCFGLTDVLRHDRPELEEDMDTYKITKSLSKVKSNMVVVTFYFE
ncbi:MAG: PorT family protein [Muribaculaceae bacterium]|nr:PorT family protein [Muribaculaceae bacterium]